MSRWLGEQGPSLIYAFHVNLVKFLFCGREIFCVQDLTFFFFFSMKYICKEKKWQAYRKLANLRDRDLEWNFILENHLFPKEMHWVAVVCGSLCAPTPSQR